jgi:hypothetical protein
MFQVSKKRIAILHTLLELVDDILADHPEEIAPHPHQRHVTLRIERRAGTVAPRPMHCLSPVRPPAERPRDRVR